MIEQKQLKYDNGKYSVDIDITVEEWKIMLLNEMIFNDVAKDMINKWYLQPNQEATHKEIMQKYYNEYHNHKSSPFNGIVNGLSNRIVKYLNRFEVVQSTGHGNSSFSIPFEGWVAGKTRNGDFVWKLRKELVKAIDELSLFTENKNRKIDAMILELEVYISEFKWASSESELTRLSNSQVDSLILKFQEKFPKEKLASFTFEEYALGTAQKEDSYSYWLEYKTEELGSTKGGSVDKHGIWLSKDGEFKATRKFSTDSKEESVKLMMRTLAELVEVGGSQNFAKIEKNLLTNTTKYKTLYLYYPDLYLPIFSDIHYSYLLKELGYNPKHYKGIMAKQKVLLEIKHKGKVLSKLTNYEYVHFLYYLFGVPRRKADNSPEIWIDGGILEKGSEGARKESHLKMVYEVVDVKLMSLDQEEEKVKKLGTREYKRDYEALQKSNTATGLRGEMLVMEYEADRLKKYPKLRNKIEHKSEKNDGLGYDILSFEVDGRERFIEVKATKGKRTSKLGFYLTAKELQVAKEKEEEGKSYWIYYVSEIDSVKPKIIPIKNPFAIENESCVEIKPLQYLVTIGVM